MGFIFELTESGNHSAAAGRLITFDCWGVVFDSQLSVAPVVPFRPTPGCNNTLMPFYRYLYVW